MGESIRELIRKSEEDSLKSTKEMEKIQQEWKVREVESSRELKKCKDYVLIHGKSDINEKKKQILQYEQQNKEYRIGIDFISYPSSLEWKTRVMDMIDSMGVNHRVGLIDIKLNSHYPISSE